MKALSVLPAFALIAACQPHPAADKVVAANSTTQTGEDYLIRIAKLNPAQLDMVLFRALRDAG